jgi:hypothetical protein
MSREEMLAELRALREPELLVADRDGADVDPTHLSDEDLREIVKLARWRTLLPRD